MIIYDMPITFIIVDVITTQRDPAGDYFIPSLNPITPDFEPMFDS